ncbi:MAG: hypothetical protein M1831_002522 [Alyxoria varia]|nr:MAG: hypothetical protein M1831_002522 [Alyxoria varia]
MADAPKADVACPDPSVHESHPSKLQDQASKAALYVTHPEKSVANDKDVLDADGKLSSAGAASSLKHARPHELPSYPTVGIGATTGRHAAYLAQNNQKTIEHWKPGLSSSAGKAALLAHRDGIKVEPWQPKQTQSGNTAAGTAVENQHSLSPNVVRGTNVDGKKRALLAATKSTSGRGRSKSNPSPARRNVPTYPDAENASHNALSAAMVANRPSSHSSADPRALSSRSDPAMEAARMKGHGQKTSRESHSGNPQASSSVQDKNHQAALRASTLSMTNQLHNAAELKERRPASSGDIRAQAKQYLHLQDAAHKLAAERLQKIDPDNVLTYRQHYGYDTVQGRSRLSIRNRRRPRSSSDGQPGNSDDVVQASKIRNQQQHLNEQVTSINEKKRATDRGNLKSAAEKAVHERMQKLDKQVFEETGKVTPAMMEEWEAKARAKANAESEARLEHHGMVDIGGGKFMTQTELESIAASRMQPTLEEIGVNAERQRARDEEIRLDQEERKRQAAKEKEREKETKAELKAQARRDKETEKARKKLEHRDANRGTGRGDEVDKADDENKDGAVPYKGGANQAETAREAAALNTTNEGLPTGSREPLAEEPRSKSDEIVPGPSTSPKPEQSKRDSRLRGLLSKLKRPSRTSEGRKPGHFGTGRSRGSTATEVSTEKPPSKTSTEEQPAARAEPEPEASSPSLRPRSRSRSISSLSSSDNDDVSSLPTAHENQRGDTISREESEEAKDSFDAGQLKMPEPGFSRTSKEGSPSRSGSRFVEDL